MPARMAYQVLGWSPGTAWQTPERLRLSGHNLWRLPFLVVLPGEVPWGGSPGEGSDTAYTLPFSLLFPPRAHLLILQYLAPKRMCVSVCVQAHMRVCERQVFIKIQNVCILWPPNSLLWKYSGKHSYMHMEIHWGFIYNSKNYKNRRLLKDLSNRQTRSRLLFQLLSEQMNAICVQWQWRMPTIHGSVKKENCESCVNMMTSLLFKYTIVFKVGTCEEGELDVSYFL